MPLDVQMLRPNRPHLSRPGWIVGVAWRDFVPKARMGEIVLASYAAPFSISVWSCRACCGITAIAAVLNVQHYGSGPPDQGSGRVPRPRSGANNDPSPLNPVKRPWGRLREGAESYAKVLDS